jgi:hypothetical protein
LYRSTDETIANAMPFPPVTAQSVRNVNHFYAAWIDSGSQQLQKVSGRVYATAAPNDGFATCYARAPSRHLLLQRAWLGSTRVTYRMVR